jgi:thioredoxin reductase (NADPH)
MSDLTGKAEWDCLIIGGGPAGLTAAIYLARFPLKVIVVDAGESRAALIPLTRNHAGFPEGISGRDLLTRMRRQTEIYGTAMHTGTVSALERSAVGFMAQTGDGSLHARSVLLATGVVNKRPTMLDGASHDLALAAGLIRYCPVCDGYGVTDRKIAVLGTGERGCREATFLRSYTADVTLGAPSEGHDLIAEQRHLLEDAGITLGERCSAISMGSKRIRLEVDGGTVEFDSLYPALGSDIRSELAGHLGAERSEEGCLAVDAHQRTTIAGLYAAGDVVLGLDQISHAMGEGGVAATTIRNDLAAAPPLRR